MIRKLIKRYEDYEREAEAARQQAHLCDGLFGFGADPRKHPCHTSFYEAAGQWVTEFLSMDPEPEQIAEAAAWFLKAADSHRSQDTYWYLYASQSHALPLIEGLDRESGKVLLEWYEKAYPARERMPVQDAVYKALRKAARKNWF